MNTQIFPALAVVSGSMCIQYDGACDGWTHPFDRTLHIGDIIVIQGVNPKDLNTDYPNSDIIVFKSPSNPSELIVHRIVGVTDVNGTLYFKTKGDGNGNPWPETPEYGFDGWDYNNPPGVPQSLVLGKVVMHVPWVGWIAIKMQEAGGNSFLTIGIISFLIVLLSIVEFVVPMLKKQPQTPQEPNAQPAPAN